MRYSLLPVFYLLLFLWPGRVAHAQAPAVEGPPEAAVRAVLAAQTEAWNRGNLDEYMRAGYWQSDSLVFVGQKGPTYGYKATLANYRARYGGATPGKMGKLTFAVRRLDVVAPGCVFVVGQWVLTRAAAGGGDAAGYFTLLFRQKAGRWVIVADHSS